MAEHKKGAVTYYLIIALILGAITYVEFAIVEYQSAISWLSPFWLIVILIVLSLIKFVLVMAIYMHLRDDDPIYTGFFSSGMVIAMGTFVALSFLFTVRSVNTYRAQQPVDEVMAAEAHGGHADAEHEIVLEPVKTLAEASHVPAPKDQRLLKISLPAAPVAEFSLRLPGLAMAEAVPQAQTEEPAMEASSAETEVAETAVETEIAAEASDSTATESSDANVEASAVSTDAPAEEPVAQVADFDWQELGEKTYTANCMACHQANGQGIPGAFPPLAAHTPDLYNAEGGRKYMINVVLYGLMGAIEVNGNTYNSVMTPWAAVLSDEQIAAVLNHTLVSWDNEALLTDFSPILPAEVAAERDQGLSSADVLGLRPEY